MSDDDPAPPIAEIHRLPDAGTTSAHWSVDLPRFTLLRWRGTRTAFDSAATWVESASAPLTRERPAISRVQRTLELLALLPKTSAGRDLRRCREHGGAEVGGGLRATAIDINMGCPVRKVVKGGGGSAMMCDTTGGTIALVAKVVEAVKVPVTVKMRLGWDADNLTAPYFAREFERVGVAAVTIHGRTREQGFSGSVNLDGIRAVVDAVERIPVIGNGDVRSIRDAERMLRVTGCAGIAIGRGALANPWFFRQLNNWLATGRPGPRGTYDERIDFMLTHFRRLIEWRGVWPACLQFRKMAAWYCKAYGGWKADQQILVMLDVWKTLYDIADRLREQGPPIAGMNRWLDANVYVRRADFTGEFTLSLRKWG